MLKKTDGPAGKCIEMASNMINLGYVWYGPLTVTVTRTMKHVE